MSDERELTYEYPVSVVLERVKEFDKLVKERDELKALTKTQEATLWEMNRRLEKCDEVGTRRIRELMSALNSIRHHVVGFKGNGEILAEIDNALGGIAVKQIEGK